MRWTQTSSSTEGENNYLGRFLKFFELAWKQTTFTTNTFPRIYFQKRFDLVLMGRLLYLRV